MIQRQRPSAFPSSSSLSLLLLQKQIFLAVTLVRVVGGSFCTAFLLPYHHYPYSKTAATSFASSSSPISSRMYSMLLSSSSSKDDANSKGHHHQKPSEPTQDVLDTDTNSKEEGQNPSAINNDEKASSHEPKRRQKLYHWTVCMVPPPTVDNQLVWDSVTKCRTELRDPGLFRWPPHANLLYPFYHGYVPAANEPATVGDTETEAIAADSSEERDYHDTINNEVDATTKATARKVFDPEILDGLVAACRQCAPFTVRLRDFGTFGGRNRGVLWLYPDSRAADSDFNENTDEPLVRLQSLLVESFPACNDQNLKSSGGGKNASFAPHMTVTHFASLDEAEAAREHWQEHWPDNLEFLVDTVYVLMRQGDDGQFQRVVDLSLGSSSSTSTVVHETPLPFDPMPATEANWVREERMKMKERRNGGRRRRNRRKSRRSKSPRVPDTPEVIAAKRAERKAKREAAAAATAEVSENTS